MWIVGFLHHEDHSGPEGPSAAQVREYERRFGARTTAGADRQAAAKLDKDRAKKEAGDKAFTKEELSRMRELERQFKREAAEARRGPLTRREKQAARLQQSAYASENRKIRKALQLRGKGGRRQLELFGSTRQRNVVKSAALENLAYLERLEQQAAVVIQRAFRKFHRILFWKKWMLASKAAVAIQRTARGFIVRRLIRDWVKQREALITKAQSVIRGKLARDEVRREREYLASAATDVQRTFRGWLHRARAAKHRLDVSATDIQRVWRGVVARSRADRLFLDSQACVVQRMVRGWLCRLKFRQDLTEQSGAARRIQALFRSYRARVLRNELLWDRETRSRETWMAILRSEQRWADSEIERRVKLRTREALDDHVRVAELEWRKQCDQVALYEFDLVSLENERLKLSPRAVQQGWAVQLKEDTEQHREWVSDFKSKALFEGALRHRTLRDRRDKADAAAADLLALRRELETRWLDERNALWRRLNERRWAAEKLELAKRAADEKRRWKVKHFTETGKPDLRLTGQLQALADGDGVRAESRVFTMATQSVLALLPPSSAAPGAPGSADAADAAARSRQLRLQAEHAAAVAPGALTAADAERQAALQNGAYAAGAGAGAGAGGAGEGWGRHPQQRLLTMGDVEAPHPRALPPIAAGSPQIAGTVDAHGNFVGFHGGAPGSAAVLGTRVLSSSPPVPPESGASLAAIRAGQRQDRHAGLSARVEAPESPRSLAAAGRGGAAAGPGGGSGAAGAAAGGSGSGSAPDEEAEAEAQAAAAAMHAAAAERADALGRAAWAQDADAALAMAHGSAGGDGSWEAAEGGAEDEVPRSRFEDEVVRARHGLGRMPAFMRSGLVSAQVGEQDKVAGTRASALQAQERQALGALASLPPGLLAAKRAGAAAAIARARAEGTVGETAVRNRRAERRAAIEEEIAEFNRQGVRVQRLADRLGAVSGAMETQQYGALLKPLFKSMGRLMSRLNADPQTAALNHAVERDPDEPDSRPASAASAGAEALTRGRAPQRRGGAGRGGFVDPRDASQSGSSLLEPVDVAELPDDYKRRLGVGLGAAREGIRSREAQALSRRGGAGGERSRRLPPLPQSRGGAAGLGGGRAAAGRGGRRGAFVVGFDASGDASGVLEPTLLPASPDGRPRPGAPAEGDPFASAARRVRRKRQQYASTIPWSLLDELEAEKDKLLEEQRRIERG
ncbi:hypothetical protein FNF28_05806 [Cafeteria roenbergensis]|uniref:Uncharacterized protein n=1 Tax=Cafeteria roenbergensis TaxID=33653 RepID=A0A5A8D2A1_CAFRO|nr:hypothetical protein FNF28_05806 [Cafeteria roenbergensis]